MKVYAIRHGESEANRLKRHAGWAQVPLSGDGRKMAEKLSPVLSSVPFDLVYSSDLCRAIQTARLALPDREPIRDARLREIGVGCLEGYTAAEMVQKYGPDYTENVRIRDFTAYGGEDHASQENRVRAFLEELSQKEDVQTAAVFCHEGSIKCMMNIVLDTEVLKEHTVLNNCAVCIFDISRDRPWKLLCWNQVY